MKGWSKANKKIVKYEKNLDTEIIVVIIFKFLVRSYAEYANIQIFTGLKTV
jgi:hypothetical protein